MQFMDSVQKGGTGVTSLKADLLKEVQTTVIINNDNKSSQRCKNKKNGEVDLDNQVRKLIHKCLGGETEKE